MLRTESIGEVLSLRLGGSRLSHFVHDSFDSLGAEEGR
jgi:hypothetical protein